MTQFEYQGLDQSGATVQGWIEATDRRSALTALASRGHIATSLDQKAGLGASAADRSEPVKAPPSRFRSGRVSSKDVLAMMTQLAAALKAGLPMMNALEVIRNQMEKPAVREVVSNLMESVSSGASLSDAMAKHPRVFKPLSCAMVRVGETGGLLEDTTLQLSRILKRDEQIRGKMISASIYPTLVLTLGLASVVFIVTQILPRIVLNITGSSEGLLPWPTEILMRLGNGIRSYGWLVFIFLLAGGYFFARWISTSSGRLQWDQFKMRVPILGKVLTAVAVGRFARTLGALTRGGVTILESLAVVRDTLGNSVLAQEIDRVAEQVKTGRPVAGALSGSGLFPPLLVQIVGVGEQTGQLDELLLNAAETFDEAADAAIARFMTVMPAALILLLAVMIAFIIIAALLPIVDMDLGIGI